LPTPFAMTPARSHRLFCFALLFPLAATLSAQHGTKNGEWRSYGGDNGNTKYSPLDQINASNVKNLQIVWRWKAENFGPRPDYLWEVTPLMVEGVLYFTAGTRRNVVAVDAATGETLWMYRLDEGERGDRAVRTVNRGLAYWTDGKDDRRVVLVTPGYQLVSLDARTGRPIGDFGKNGLVELTEGLDRDTVPPGVIGSSSPAMIIRDVVVVGNAFLAGTAPASKNNVPGYIRGYDVRTGKKLWTFRTIPRPGEPGVETWEKESWAFSGNTGAWAPLAGDEELGYVYIPVESATGDFYGGHRPGDNLYSGSLVCLDARTGRRVWHFQVIHHDIWDYEPSCPPILADVTVNGRLRKIVAMPMKTAHTYVFDRVTGEPIWPIPEVPMPASTVPGEWTSPTQPIPSKPAPFDRVGITPDILIDFTPELKAEALKILEQYNYSHLLYPPPIVRGTNGKIATLLLPHHTGGSNWPGGALDPETGYFFISSLTNPDPMALQVPDPRRSDMAYVGGAGRGGPAGGAARGGPAPAPAPARGGPAGGDASTRGQLGPQGLPLIKPPWGRVTAINLNTGDHAWMVPNGDVPDAVKNHPALKGIDLGQTGRPERAPLMVTKTLLFAADGAGMFNSGPGGGGNKFRALDKKTGATIHEMALPANATGIPMTYLVNGRQHIVVAVGARNYPAELVALAVPE
jgi:quinoprotein glucose dehydrogenase